MPEYSYVYLGDNARAPYGPHGEEMIYNFTKEGVAELFGRGTELVVLACNTSSAVALKKIQQEFLPKEFPDKRVLGIIIPTAEEIGNTSSAEEIGVLGTEATINSKVYEKEIEKHFPELKIHGQSCPLLVPIIEAGETEWEGLESATKKYLVELFKKSEKVDSIILGCTHYGIIEDLIAKNIPANVKIISQGKIIAEKLKNYLSRHPEIDGKIEKNGKRIFLTTENSDRISKLAGLFLGKAVNFEKTRLD